MVTSNRNTIVVPDRLAMRQQRLDAARARRHGAQILSFEQLALRLAGGFTRAVDDDSLRQAIQLALVDAPLGELDGIKRLPGMVHAAATTLRKAWQAGIGLHAEADAQPRLASVARLEAAVLAALSPAQLRPADIVQAALARMTHAPVVLGPVDLAGVADLAPCWRPLLLALAKQVPVRWLAGARAVPDWLEGSAVEIVRAAPARPSVQVVSAATPLHEAIEAMRWARGLLASGQAQAHEIALASTTPARFDAHLFSLRDEAGLDLHFAHGVATLASREGQAAAALAEIVLHGLSRMRLRRLARLCGNDAPALKALPKDWLQLLPRELALATPASWQRLVKDLATPGAADGAPWAAPLAALLGLLDRGIAAAAEIGEGVLSGRARTVWRKALLTGPAASLETTLAALHQDDGLDPCSTLAWMPASMLAASPRRFVRLLGVNAAQWPRASGEDRLLPDHVVPRRTLDPLPLELADRRDFATILATTTGAVSLSYARREGEGRLLGRSALLADIAGLPREIYLHRNAVPAHAFSTGDRLAARPAESAQLPQALAAAACWRNWHDSAVTAHDGMVRAAHPALLHIAHRTHSASSLRLLLRNPVGYVWRYGLRLSGTSEVAPSLTMERSDFGNLVHEVLDASLQQLEVERAGAAKPVGPARMRQVVEEVVALRGAAWESAHAVPPGLLWHRQLQDVSEQAQAVLHLADSREPGARAYGEVAFGGAVAKNAAVAPWDAAAPVEIAGTGMRIAGHIDRLDVTADGRGAVVRDYKTGKFPKGDALVIDGGKELQRCLYALAAQSLLGDAVTVRATLLYPREQRELELGQPAVVLADVVGFLRAGHDNLVAGHAVPGPDTADAYNELAFALPANAAEVYCKRKSVAAGVAMGPATKVWEAP